MVATFVIRLVAERLSRGEFVGQVEHVASGRIQTVHDADELAAFAADAERPPVEPER